MDTRLVVIGISILTVSAGFIVYGIITSNNILTGVSLSSCILGSALACLGLTYRDPVSEAFNVYGRLLSSALVRVYEDLDLIGGGLIQTCMADGGIYLVCAKSVVECDGISPGLGVGRNTPYLAFFVEDPMVGGDLESVLMRLGLADNIVVRGVGDGFQVEFRGLRRSLIGVDWRPLNIFQILIPVYISSCLKRNIVVYREEYVGSLYRIYFRVLEGGGSA